MLKTKRKRTKAELEGMQRPEDCIVHMRTNASIPLRVLMDTIHPILMDGTLMFDETGMQIKGMNTIILCQAKVEVADYVCKQQEKISISFSSLHSCLSSIAQDEDVCFQLTDYSMNCVCPFMGVYIINTAKDQDSVFSFQLPLLALDEEDFDVPNENFPSTVSIPSTIFNRVLRCCDKRGELVQIVTRNQDKDSNFVIIRTSGDDASLNFHLRFQVDEDEWTDSSCLKLDLYSLKYLLLITKATALSGYVTLFLKKRYPLVIKYNIGTVGELMFCLSPQVDESPDVPPPVITIDSLLCDDNMVSDNDDDAIPSPHLDRSMIKRRRRKRKRPVEEKEPATTTQNDDMDDLKMSGDFIVDQDRRTPVGKREIITKTPPRQRKLTFQPVRSKKDEEVPLQQKTTKKIAPAVKTRVPRLPANLSAAMSLTDLD